ncbi:MAG: hypothetical protein ACKOYN_00470 [Planctomycetota bacterium]
MLSHCCARCGRNLDASSRLWSADLRMWVAACPRCGFAVAWGPRRAREAARIWSRLRSLNIRLGIAVFAGQLAALTLVVAVDVVVHPRAGIDAMHPGVIAAAAVAAGLVGISAVALAPHRNRALAAIVSWIAVVAPTSAVAAAVISIPNPRAVEPMLGVLASEFGPLCAVGAAAMAASTLIALALGAAYDPFRRAFGRRDRTMKRTAIGSPSGNLA